MPRPVAGRLRGARWPAAALALALAVYLLIRAAAPPGSDLLLPGFLPGSSRQVSVELREGNADAPAPAPRRADGAAGPADIAGTADLAGPADAPGSPATSAGSAATGQATGGRADTAPSVSSERALTAATSGLPPRTAPGKKTAPGGVDGAGVRTLGGPGASVRPSGTKRLTKRKEAPRTRLVRAATKKAGKHRSGPVARVGRVQTAKHAPTVKSAKLRAKHERAAKRHQAAQKGHGRTKAHGPAKRHGRAKAHGRSVHR